MRGGGGLKKKWENVQDEQDLQHSCEMEEEKSVFYLGGQGTPQILFEGHVMPSGGGGGIRRAKGLARGPAWGEAGHNWTGWSRRPRPEGPGVAVA